MSNETELFENFTTTEDTTLLGTLKVSNAVSGNGDTELSIDANVATLVYISDTRTSSSIDVSSSTANILIYGAGFDNTNATVSAVLGYENIYNDDGSTLYTCPCTSQYISATSITIAFSYLVLEDASINTTCTTCTLVVTNLTYEGISIGNGTYVGETLSVVETVAVNVIQSNDNGTVTIFGSGFGESSSDAYSVTLSAAFLGQSETTTSCDGVNNIADGASVTHVSSHEIVVTGIHTASCNGTLILNSLNYVLSGTAANYDSTFTTSNVDLATFFSIFEVDLMGLEAKNGSVFERNVLGYAADTDYYVMFDRNTVCGDEGSLSSNEATLVSYDSDTMIATVNFTLPLADCSGNIYTYLVVGST